MYHVYLNTQCQICCFDVMIDRLHDVALTVGSSLNFTQVAVKLVVQYGMCCGLCPGNTTGLVFWRLTSRQRNSNKIWTDPGNRTGILVNTS